MRRFISELPAENAKQVTEAAAILTLPKKSMANK